MNEEWEGLGEGRDERKKIEGRDERKEIDQKKSIV
jgi:hypothetical protein